MKSRLSVIVPTISRPTLAATVDSIAPQLLDDDELIVVHDGPPENKGRVPTRVKHRGIIRYMYTPERTANSGGSQRDYGISLCRGTHLLFCDDDDTYVPDALKTVRQNIALYGEQKTFIYQMRYGNGLVLWRTPELLISNVGTPMFVVPYRDKLPRWAEFDEAKDVHDALWIAAVCKRFGSPVFIPKVLCHIRPAEWSTPLNDST